MMLRRYAVVAIMLSSLVATPVLAEETTNVETTQTSPPIASDTVVKPQLDLACMQTAVEKRENAIIAAVETEAAAVKAALAARRDALKAAWSITDRKERNAKIRAAWAEFNGTWRKANKALNRARRAAWKQFRADAKSCNAHREASVEMRGESSDAKL